MRKEIRFWKRRNWGLNTPFSKQKMNIIGQRFGKLLVIGKASRKGYVICQCECSTIKEIRAANLTKRNMPTLSCGCLRKEKAIEVGNKTIKQNSKKRIESDKKFNTNFGVIENSELPKNNQSGCKGVWYDASRDNYQVYIQVHRKRISLGRVSTFEEAVRKRKEAEEIYYSPLISEKEKENKEEGCA